MEAQPKIVDDSTPLSYCLTSRNVPNEKSRTDPIIAIAHACPGRLSHRVRGFPMKRLPFRNLSDCVPIVEQLLDFDNFSNNVTTTNGSICADGWFQELFPSLAQNKTKW